jgi:hypothetical protein
MICRLLTRQSTSRSQTAAPFLRFLVCVDVDVVRGRESEGGTWEALDDSAEKAFDILSGLRGHKDDGQRLPLRPARERRSDISLEMSTSPPRFNFQVVMFLRYI